jgi:hypothetical protein
MAASTSMGMAATTPEPTTVIAVWRKKFLRLNVIKQV